LAVNKEINKWTAKPKSIRLKTSRIDEVEKASCLMIKKKVYSSLRRYDCLAYVCFQLLSPEKTKRYPVISQNNTNTKVFEARKKRRPPFVVILRFPSLSLVKNNSEKTNFLPNPHNTRKRKKQTRQRNRRNMDAAL